MTSHTRGSIPDPQIDLVFDTECPNVDDARALLRSALTEAGFPETWREWERDADGTPTDLRGLGSPTILVNGVDVSGVEPGAVAERANCCRVYEDAGRLRGVPPLNAVLRALSRAGIAT